MADSHTLRLLPLPFQLIFSLVYHIFQHIFQPILQVGTSKAFGFIDVLAESSCQWESNLDFVINDCFMKSRG